LTVGQYSIIMKKHYESYLEKCGWPVEATIDYRAFKELLRFFVDRRKQWRTKIIGPPSSDSWPIIADDEYDEDAHRQPQPTPPHQSSSSASYVAMEEHHDPMMMMESTAAAATTRTTTTTILATHPAFRHYSPPSSLHCQATMTQSLAVREHDELRHFLQYETQKAILYYQTLVDEVRQCLLVARNRRENRGGGLSIDAGARLVQAALYHATTILTVRQIFLRYHDFQTQYHHHHNIHGRHNHDDDNDDDLLATGFFAIEDFMACGTNLANAAPHPSSSPTTTNTLTTPPTPPPRHLDDVFQWEELWQLYTEWVATTQQPNLLDGVNEDEAEDDRDDDGTNNVMTATAVQAILEQVEQILAQSEMVSTTAASSSSRVDHHHPHRAVTSVSPMLTFKLLRHYILSTLQSVYGLHMYRRHLKGELRAIAKLQKKMILNNNNDPQQPDQQFRHLHHRNRYPLLLNLLSCFLYMMNNYIIEPSSAYYANALGAHDAVSGIMIGGASWFALISAIGYSYWTNVSYKAPILFAGCLMVVGNIMYGAADAHHSLTVCLLGRALVGLGAPRVINRRYVADATPFYFRTMASAGFCLATAFGCSFGPAMAIVLDALPAFTILKWRGRSYEWNGLTAPGYFMALLWTIYTVTILCTFAEPVRSGLDELKQREQQQQRAQQAQLILQRQQQQIQQQKQQEQPPPLGKNSALLESREKEGEEDATTVAMYDDEHDDYAYDDDTNSVGSSMAAQSYASSIGIGGGSRGRSRHGKDRKGQDVNNNTTSSSLFSGWCCCFDSSKNDDGDGWGITAYCGCCRHITVAVALTMSLIFMKRIALECIVGSTSIITKNRYGWSIQNVGTLQFANGLLIIPVSALAGWLSTKYEDRCLALTFLAVTATGMMILIDYADLTSFLLSSKNDEYAEKEDDDNRPFGSVGPNLYIVGTLIAFAGIWATESYVASMMSKVVPSALAVGTFNSGLLATLVGTGGRAVGDLFITLMGLISLRHLLNLLMVPALALVVLSMVLIRVHYGRLKV
jgi:hypothetical protein